ncbi:MAG: nucleotidyltransferase family protein [Methylomonas sp.]|nr:nucleotidyltransferase family protein [Methylomonas sp.]
MNSIVGILLAAGSGKRFGGDKLMQTLPNGEPIAVMACRHLLAGTDEVLAVVRPGCGLLAERLQAEGAIVEVCEHADRGMGSSLAYGIKASPKASGWLIALADMPWIEPASICSVADALRSGAVIAAPSFHGRRGHPVGFSGQLRDELAALNGDVGARTVIQSHLDRLHIVECDDRGILRDVDYPDDLTLSKKIS